MGVPGDDGAGPDEGHPILGVFVGGGGGVHLVDDLLLALGEDAGLDEVRERGEALLDGQAHQAEGQHETQVEVAHDGAPHEAAALVVVPHDAGGDPHGGRVRPRQQLELGPPSVGVGERLVILTYVVASRQN